MINKNWENDEDIDIGDNVSISTLSRSITLNDGDWNNITIKNENLAVLRDEIDKIIKRIDSGKPSGYMLDGVPIEEFTQASKLEKPENMAIEGTARISTVITEPNFMAGAIAESMTIDGVRVGDGYNFDDVSVSDIDTNKMRNLVKK